MITPEGWFDFAVRHPGPAEKAWGDVNTIEAVFFHSAVGTAQGVINIVDGPVSNQRSVTGVIHYDGTLTQFYPVTMSPWANGSHGWNRRALGFETEGGGYHSDGSPNFSEPETDEQVATQTRILRDLAAFKGVGVDYWQRPSTLKEHREVYATACPSGRVPWDRILTGLQEKPMDGWQKRGKQMVLVNEGIEVLKVGDESGDFPGRIAKNFGGQFWWLRGAMPIGMTVTGPLRVDAYWSPEEGD